MKKKLYVIAIIIALVMSLLIVNVNAATESFSAALAASSTNVEKGKEFTVNLSVSNLNVGDKGINSLSGYLKIDDKVFESVSSDSVEGSSGCSVVYSEESGKLVVTKVGFINKDSDICQITLKTKSSTTATKGTIELKDIVASNSESEITTDDISLEISIGKDKETDKDKENTNSNSIKISSGNNSNKNNSNKNSNSNSNKNKNTSNNSNNDGDEPSPIVANTNNSSNNSNNNANSNLNTSNNANNSNNANVNTSSDEDEMPDTGLDDTMVKAILLVALVGVLGYIKLKSLDRK